MIFQSPPFETDHHRSWFPSVPPLIHCPPPPPPLLLSCRYAEAAGLDGPGREVLQYLVCLQTGEYRHMGQLDPISVKGVASVLEMGITEVGPFNPLSWGSSESCGGRWEKTERPACVWDWQMFKFLSSDRAYMKEGLFPYLNSTEINLYDK